MARRVCTVTLTDAAGLRHTAEVSAETLFEAAALGLAAMRGDEWANAGGASSTLEVRVVPPTVTHSVSIQQVLRWLDGATPSPKERVKKENLKLLLRR